ncbi:MAG TPA: hypothetical protein VFW47_08865, partial [Phenylobacterium sp.]|nr:hypothetical protein [Phenylobacterium sp.]
MKPVPITYFSDMLCMWAYVSQVRVNAIKAKFGDSVRIEPKFCSVFGDTARKVKVSWGDRGGYEGFNAHLLEAAAAFPEIRVNPDIWRTARPASSTGVHLFLKALGLAEAAGGCADGATEAA